MFTQAPSSRIEKTRSSRRAADHHAGAEQRRPRNAFTAERQRQQRTPSGSSPRRGGRSEPPGESAPGAERYVPTDSAEKSATNPGMRRAEQVISGLPPGPAANAARQPRRRAGRQPEPSPRRAGRLARKRRAHPDSETVRQSASSPPRRTPRRAHRAGFTHTDRSTRPAARGHVRAEREPRQDNPESRAEQQAITETPSSSAPRRLPPKDRRRRTNNLQLQEFSTKWRAMPTAA